MGVGHDIAVGRQDEARAHAARTLFLLRLLRPVRARARTRVARQRLPEEAPEELLHLLVHFAAAAARGHFLDGADTDHGRADLLYQIGEIGQSARLRRLRHGRRGRHETHGCRTGHAECEEIGTKLVSLDFEHHRFSFKRTERPKEEEL
ncbi:hypothetical protein D9M68_738060 [compost metagenome]